MSTRYKVYAFTDASPDRPTLVYEEELADHLSGGGGGGESITVSDVIYVDPDTGNDSTGDGTPGSPYQTLQTGIDNAVSGQAVVCLGAGDFAEDVEGKEGVDVIAPHSNLTLNDGNQLKFADGRYVFRRVIRTSGTGPMMISDNQLTYAIVNIFEINDTGSGDTILGNNSAPTDIGFSQVFIGNGNSFVRTQSTSQHIHIHGEDIYLTAANTTGITIDGGASVLMTVHHFKEIGDGVGSGRAFDIINGDINVSIQDIKANTLADISADGTLNIIAQQAEGAVNNSNGVYTYFYNEFGGSTRIGTDLTLSLAASSYVLEKFSGNDGAFLTLGENGAIVPATVNQGSTVWSDDTEAFTDISTTTEETVYEVAVDQNFTAGSVEFDITIEYPFFRQHVVRLYKDATLLDEQTFNGSSTPLNFSGAIAITTPVVSGDNFRLTLQTDMAPAFEPNRGDIQNGGFLRVTKSGQGFGGIGLYILITDADSPYTIESGEQIIVDTTGGAVTVIAPVSGNFSVSDVGGNASVNNITIDLSAKNLLLNGATQNSFVHDLNNEKLLFIDDGTNYRKIT